MEGASAGCLYYPNEHILLVGEADFTFSSALASIIKDSRNLYATTDKSQEYTRRMYAQAPKALSNLLRRGAKVVYNFDATQDIVAQGFFHRIIFNFPHAGYFGRPEWVRYVITQHQELIRRFLANASKLIRPYDGEIHITVQDYDPYKRWDISGLARSCGLRLKQSVIFDMGTFTGYTNRRGSGRRAGGTFPFGRGYIRTHIISF
ncbi:hypothetical protein R1flu_009337 [Riccia fluitans]|uniref:25S rRNA (uridine-N(3))-methyltransferase BMT5-like domain-containing protein n=1 Tax=Riccia fluitans TaxID=41844 RepID=A0ABD1Z2M9_9MARC